MQVISHPSAMAPDVQPGVMKNEATAAIAPRG